MSESGCSKEICKDNSKEKCIAFIRKIKDDIGLESHSKRVRTCEPNEQIPSTSKNVVQDNIMIDNPSEELNRENVHRTSDEVCVEDINSNTSRIEYDFWNSSSSGVERVHTVPQPIKINKLFIGKIVNKILKVRITYISEIRNTKTGNVITFHGKDEVGEIAIINFGNGCQNLYNFLKINIIISIQNFAVNQENLNYPSGTGNALEIRLNNDSEVEEVEDDKSIPEIFFKFVALDDLQRLNKNDRIDVIGIFVEDFGLERNYRGTVMREFALTDLTKENLIVTLWGLHAEKFSADKYSVVVIRKGVVTEFNGKKKLNCVNGTLVWVAPELPDAASIHEGFMDLLERK